MHQYECGNCGYDMTGIERFTNTVDVFPYAGMTDMTSMFMGGFYNSLSSNTVTCPNCGKSGYWIKH